MNLVRTLKTKKTKNFRMIGIDASSIVIAFSFFEQRDGEAYLVNVTKVSLSNFTMYQKLKLISTVCDKILPEFEADYIFVEQPIYIQNPATSRVLSQISGHLLGKCLQYCDKVEEVTIATWKSYIGYKNVSKAEKTAWEKEFGATEAKKIAKKERKERTIRIIHEKIPGTEHIDDNDVCDAIGIGLYGLNYVNSEK
jgi:Holliday junction resolvasome RuvABC endonuclease subunit